MHEISNAINSLKNHNYHKLIIGAALKDYDAIKTFAYLFTHAGADAIDISAFPHSVICAKSGIDQALAEDPSLKAPVIMISVNIGDDPHFRRIEVDFDNCTHCLLCVPSCPSEAFSIFNNIAKAQISQNKNETKDKLNYDIDLCFACSNCLDYCHFDALHFKNWSAFDPKSITELIKLGANAIEIHLNNDLQAFESFYRSLPKFEKPILESFSIGSELMTTDDLIRASDKIIEEVHLKHGEQKVIIIQTDGIPISGAREITDKDLRSINNAEIILNHINKPKPRNNFAKSSSINDSQNNNIFIQLAGGIDENSLAKAHSLGVKVNGVAIGSSARKRLQKYLTSGLQDAINESKKILKTSKDKLQKHALEVQCI